MVTKWVLSPAYKWVYWGYNPLILTFDPNFLGHPSGVPPMGSLNINNNYIYISQMLNGAGVFTCIYPQNYPNVGK